MKRLWMLTTAVAVFALFTYFLSRTPAKSDGKTVVVVMETSMGTVEIELNAGKAPITVKNFLEYVDDKFFDDTIFHRVIETFMIQGGGFKRGMDKKETKKPIKNEAANGLSNVRGTIAMARLPDPNSATAQFYINVTDNSESLDKNDESAGYCVFGKVIKGMDVVDKIKAVQTHTVEKEIEIDGVVRKIPFKNVPEKDVVIKSIRRAPVK